MKSLLLLLPFAMLGCRTAAPAAMLTPPAVTAPAPSPSTDTAFAALERKVRRQAQYIEALISQNDALAAKLAVREAKTVPAAAAQTVATQPRPAPAQKPVPAAEPVLVPNADGVIDLSAANAPKAGEPVNPFTVRAPAGGPLREVTIQVSGIIAGPAVCAIINDRLVSAGDSVESLTVDHIDPDAVFLRRDGRRLRLPVTGKPFRVRLAP